ncbi:hypothetical protein [Brevibacillus panacihumi]|nr:hypothetical protein [Brevibacillus panacihumi]
MTHETFLQNVKQLVHMHQSGLLGGEVMPEDALIGIVPDEDLPNVLTLAMSLNYQRNAYTLWQSVAHAYQDEGTRWIFRPFAAVTCEREELRNVLIHHRVALQPNRHPEIWQRVAQGIVDSSPDGSVAGMLQSCNYDVASLIDLMQVRRKSSFPYLSGPKIFHYWLYVLESYAGIAWKSRELITIAPDTHILQGSVQLGLCSEKVLQGSTSDRQAVASAWETALKGSGLAPIDVHTPLWLWSRAGFPPLYS